MVFVCLQSIMLEKKYSKNHGLLEFALGSSFGGGLDEKFGRP